jgi:hypothetical protein
LVEVPMVVTTPPRITAEESGFRKRDGGTPRLSDHSATTGISIATIGVLLRKAEAAAEGAIVSRAGARLG